MEKTQFHKYQICEWEGREGVIIRTDYPDKGTIQFAFDNGYLYFTHDGRITPNSPVSLRPVGEARRVLTEWQRKRLMECHWMKNKFIMDDIESILSTPEPPKWEPKEGEPVLVKQRIGQVWHPRISTGIIVGKEYGVYHVDMRYTVSWNYCIPFDPAKVGTVTND